MYTHRPRPCGWRHALEPWSLGLVFHNLQTVWASAALAAPKKGGFWLMSDYHALNKQIEKVPGHVEARGGDGRLAGGDMFWEA